MIGSEVIAVRDIGKNIRDLRIRKNMTQDELAGLLFVTRQTVSNYETGRSRPDVEMLMKIAEALETDVNAVLYGQSAAPGRERDRRRLVLTAGITVLVFLFTLWAERRGMDLQAQTYQPHWRILGAMLLEPVSYSLLGFCAMMAAGFALKARPLREPTARYLLWGAAAVWTLYLIAYGPLLVQMFSYCLNHWFGTPVIEQVQLPLQKLLGTCSLNILPEYCWSFIFVGAALWLGRPHEKEGLSH